jgi:tRNA A37 methylthiotransferase MiaB
MIRRSARRFPIFLIKPSHYDDEGYVIQWLRSTMPSNSLAVVDALARSAAKRRILGLDVEIEVSAIDETNRRVSLKSIVARLTRNQNFGFVGLVGVQSNEFPRALDLARPLRQAGINVVIGGFHVSGCLAMLPEMPADLAAAIADGITLFAGECETHLDDLIVHAAGGRLRAIYDYTKMLPDIWTVEAPPFLPVDFVKRTVGNVTSFDAGRGCPFQCSFCTIINVQGRKSRFRSPDSIEQIIRSNWAQGVDRFFITDDNFARNKNWEAIYDRIIELREEDGLDVRFMIQVDTLCHKIPGFIEKSRRAGVTRVFIGLENINPDNLLAAKKRQNKLTEYRRMLLAWKSVGVMTFAGYILGFPHDTPQSIARDLDIIKDELPIDALEFFILTPLPGSEDHKLLSGKGVPMDGDMNRYTLEHVVTDHSRMSRSQWQQAYRAAWEQFYSVAHLETILRRAHASGINIWSLRPILLWFSSAVPLENVHPLQAGIFRRKRRIDRRGGMPLEPRLTFYAKYASALVRKHTALYRRWRMLIRLCRKIEKEDPNRLYKDRALLPHAYETGEDWRLYNQTVAAKSAVHRERRVAGRSAILKLSRLDDGGEGAPTLAQPG